jgi:hypothetical protein
VSGIPDIDKGWAANHTRFVLVALVTIGVLLILFGGVVLLRFPDRPGGQIEFHGVKIDSRSAGLPLIVLGLTAVVLAVLVDKQPAPTASTSTASPTGTTGQQVTSTPTTSRDATSTAGPASSAGPASCINEHLETEPSVHINLRTRLPEGQTAQLIGRPAALILMQDTEITGAIRLQYQPVGQPTLTVIDVVDGSCRPGTSMVQEVHNGFTVRLVLADRQYRLAVDYGSDTASRAIPKVTLTRPA